MLINTEIANAGGNKEIHKLQKKAYRAFVNRDYDSSLVYLLKLDSLNTEDSVYCDYMIGMCLLSTKDKTKAIPYLERTRKSLKTSFVVDYYLGRAYLYAGRYSDAKIYLTSYIGSLGASDIKLNKETTELEYQKIHVEKTIEEVELLVMECDSMLQEFEISKKD